MTSVATKSPKKPTKPEPTLAPMQGEKQDQFFDRANRALAKRIPSVNRRTNEILKIWTRSPNAAGLNEKAQSRFSDDKYIHYGPRCVFMEHTVPSGEDRPEIVYNRNALQKLVDWANHRIADTETFAAISEGHTPSEEEKAAGITQPEVLGYAGPFYLGLLGDVEPKWSIYADEWVHAEDVGKFEKLQRRSPEVWVSEPIERRTMDPIAALGAETPRLDSGMNAYKRASDGQQVMRYSAAGGPMVMPGPQNTFIPSGERRKTVVDYSGASKMDMPGVAEKPSVGAAFGKALMELLPSLVQSIDKQMSPDPADQDMPADDTPRGMDPDVPDAVPDAPEAPGNDVPGDPDDDKYKAMGAECYAAYSAGKSKAMAKYAKGGTVDRETHAVIARQQTQMLAMKGEIASMKSSLEQERRDVLRYSKLSELGQSYELDGGVQGELELVKDYTDAQFDKHCEKVITRYSKRDDVTAFTIYDDPTVRVDQYSGRGAKPSEQQIEQYSREAAERAANKNFKKANSTTFDAELQAILKDKGVAV